MRRRLLSMAFVLETMVPVAMSYSSLYVGLVVSSSSVRCSTGCLLGGQRQLKGLDVGRKGQLHGSFQFVNGRH